MSDIDKIKAVLNEINESSNKYPGNFKSDSFGDIWNDSIFNHDDIKDAEGLHPVLLTTLNISDSELASYFVLAVNTITHLTKALEVAVNALVGDVKTLKTIAEILEAE